MGVAPQVSGLDALWAGLPLLTLAGANMARRCGASFLRTTGVPGGYLPPPLVLSGHAASLTPY